MDDTFDIMLVALGIVAHATCIAGVVVSLIKKNRTTTFWFALFGLLSVLALLVASWVVYSLDLDMMQEGKSLASGHFAFEVQLRGIGYAMERQTLALLGAALPFLLSLFLTIRGAMLPRKEKEQARGPLVRSWTAIYVASAAALLGVSLLTYLDFGAFLYALLRWMV
jgi:hypothetical protein